MGRGVSSDYSRGCKKPDAGGTCLGGVTPASPFPKEGCSVYGGGVEARSVKTCCFLQPSRHWASQLLFTPFHQSKSMPTSSCVSGRAEVNSLPLCFWPQPVSFERHTRLEFWSEVYV